MTSSQDTPKSARDPNRYISNNLTVGAWHALADLQSSARMTGLNPSKSTLLVAAITVAEAHMDEVIATLEGPE